MKRLFPAALKTWLLNPANRNCHRADLFLIHLTNGATLQATDGQWDVTLKPNTPGWGGPLATFSAAQYGRWSRSAITSEAGTKLSSNTTTLTCVPQPSTKFPGLDLGLLSGALNHLFDGALVFVFTAYMPLGQYGNVIGISTKFQGTITRVPTLVRNKVEYEAADPLYLLNMKVPSRLVQSNCGWAFTDANCGLAASDYTVQFTTHGATQTALVASAPLGTPDGYFAQGVVTCLTGANAGLSQTVKASTSQIVTVVVPWILPVRDGDTFSVLKGCDKTAATCQATARANGSPEPNDYRTRFGGTPFAPVPSTVV